MSKPDQVQLNHILLDVDFSKTLRGKNLRRQVAARDFGVCEICRLDTHQLFEVLKNIFRNKRRGNLTNQIINKYSWAIKFDLCGDHQVRRWVWEADHSEPLCEGGLDDLSNLRTLCIPCHAKQTASLNKRVANRRLTR